MKPPVQLLLSFMILSISVGVAANDGDVDLPDAYEDERYRIYLEDHLPDLPTSKTSRLEYAKSWGPDWIQVSRSGVLSGTARSNNVGRNFAEIEMRDDYGDYYYVKVSIEVRPYQSGGGSDRPRWTDRDIYFGQICANSEYSIDLTDYVDCANPRDLYFYLNHDSPRWTRVSSRSRLNFRPGRRDIGRWDFELIADGRGGSDRAQASIRVIRCP